MRPIVVADVARSVAFYKDVLGFELREQDGATELLHGPACLRLETQGDDASILFFETSDVEATHARLAARGAAPSAMEKVNWIKMRMFEIRDPDGHVIWFGQSFHQGPDNPSRRPGQPSGIRQALPELPVDNVPAAVDYYRDVLGFRVNYQQDDLGVMDRDAVTILLIERTPKHTGIGSCGFYVENADSLYAELKQRGANLEGEPVSWPWGLRNFRVLDCEGNRLVFSQTFE